MSCTMRLLGGHARRDTKNVNQNACNNAQIGLIVMSGAKFSSVIRLSVVERESKKHESQGKALAGTPKLRLFELSVVQPSEKNENSAAPLHRSWQRQPNERSRSRRTEQRHG